jgi:hydroxyacylglutathione hydrolase
VDTHIHADHRSTGPELARRAGAEYLLHTRAGFRGPFSGIDDGDLLRVGRVTMEVLHTPGHSPESVCLAVADLKRAEVPWFVLTGDTLFVGDVGRPDVHVGARVQAAGELHASLEKLLQRLGDGVEVFPAHYAGSSCGRYLSPKPSSTLGFERRHNVGLKCGSLAAFVEYAQRDLPPIDGAEDTLRFNRGMPPA